MFSKRKQQLKKTTSLLHLRAVYLLFVGIILLVLAILAIFIHRYVYATLELANVVVILRSEIGIDTINFPKLQEVKTTWEKKSQPTELPQNNPFFSQPTEKQITSTTTIVTEPQLETPTDSSEVNLSL